MCGRLTQVLSWRQIYDLLAGDLRGAPVAWEPDYNVCPGGMVVALSPAPGAPAGAKLELGRVRWGMRPGWYRRKDPGRARHRPLINARSEKYVQPGRPWCAGYARCAVPAGGFYEWRRTGASRQAYYIRGADGPLLWIGGLVGREPSTEAVGGRTCVLLTTEANDLMGFIHNTKKRMPVLLSGETLREWLDPSRPRTELRALVEPCGDERLVASPVGPEVNRGTASGPGLVEPIGPPLTPEDYRP